MGLVIGVLTGLVGEFGQFLFLRINYVFCLQCVFTIIQFLIGVLFDFNLSIFVYNVSVLVGIYVMELVRTFPSGLGGIGTMSNLVSTLRHWNVGMLVF